MNAHLGDQSQHDDRADPARVDLKKQQDLTHEFIRYMTGKAYRVPRPIGAKNFGVYCRRSATSGFNTYAGGSRRQVTIRW
jgi:hypothetical protein